MSNISVSPAQLNQKADNSSWLISRSLKLLKQDKDLCPTFATLLQIWESNPDNVLTLVVNFVLGRHSCLFELEESTQPYTQVLVSMLPKLERHAQSLGYDLVGVIMSEIKTPRLFDDKPTQVHGRIRNNDYYLSYYINKQALLRIF